MVFSELFGFLLENTYDFWSDSLLHQTFSLILKYYAYLAALYDVTTSDFRQVGARRNFITQVQNKKSKAVTGSKQENKLKSKCRKNQLQQPQLLPPKRLSP